MTVQKAEDRHLEDIKRIWIDLMVYHSKFEPFWEMSDDAIDNFTWWMSREIHNEDSCVLVALDREKVVGYVGGIVKFHPPVFRETRHFLITDMQVDIEYRRQGIGEALMNELYKWTAGKDIKRIELGVAPKNSIGHSFWEKMGFQEYLVMMAKYQ
jgi:GNAT superfamily N-acetyltransferase